MESCELVLSLEVVSLNLLLFEVDIFKHQEQGLALKPEFLSMPGWPSGLIWPPMVGGFLDLTDVEVEGHAISYPSSVPW